MVYPGGAFSQVTQFSCELLCLTHNEWLSILVPGCVDDVTDVTNIGAQDGNCETACVEV